MILEAGLPPGELVQRLVSANRTTAMGNRALAFYLHDMQSRGEHHALSFASAAHFAMARLEMGKTAAYELVSLGAALDGLPRIDAAFCEGEISWTKVKLLCSIAAPDTKIAWLELGKELNCRQLAQEVASSEKGRPPRKNRRGPPHLCYVVKARVDATRRDVACEEEAITRQHVAQALREFGIDDRGLDRTDRKVLELLVKKGRAISQRGIAMMASLPLATYRDVVEPYLVRAGWIEVTPRGRVVAAGA
jgi:hypothetical protein